jgi:signal transduction histidine kinase
VDALQSIFIRNVSHEFRTPLGIVLGYAELLHDGDLGALRPEQEEALVVVMNSLNRLQKTVDQIVTLMAAELASRTLLPLNLLDVALQAVEKQRARAEQAGLDLEVLADRDLPLVAGDPHQLEQVVDSLLENACKFTPEGGSIEVELYAQEEWVCLVVSDTGIGIPQQELGRIFSGFYQVDGSTSRRYGGLGLGLTLVTAVVEAHGGSIEVKSQEGQGSRFFIRLPACGFPIDWDGQAGGYPVGCHEMEATWKAPSGDWWANTFSRPASRPGSPTLRPNGRCS